MGKRVDAKKASSKRREGRKFKAEGGRTEAVGCKTRFVRALRHRCPGLRITFNTIDALMQIMTQVSVEHLTSVRCMVGRRVLQPVDVYRHQATMSASRPGMVQLLRAPATTLAEQIVNDLRNSQYAASIGVDHKSLQREVCANRSKHLADLSLMPNDKETINRAWALSAVCGIHPEDALLRSASENSNRQCRFESELTDEPNQQSMER